MSLSSIIFIYSIKNSNCGGSCIDSPEWITNKKVTINPINKNNNKCIKYAVTAALNHVKIKKKIHKKQQKSNLL